MAEIIHEVVDAFKVRREDVEVEHRVESQEESAPPAHKYAIEVHRNGTWWDEGSFIGTKEEVGAYMEEIRKNDPWRTFRYRVMR